MLTTEQIHAYAALNIGPVWTYRHQENQADQADRAEEGNAAAVGIVVALQSNPQQRELAQALALSIRTAISRLGGQCEMLASAKSERDFLIEDCGAGAKAALWKKIKLVLLATRNI